MLLLLVSEAAFGKLRVVVSVVPEQTFVQAIGGAYVTVSTMVLPGNSPHTYEPKPSQMKAISAADLYLSIGVEFEKVWLPKFAAQNPTMQIVDLSSGITKSPIANHHHEVQESAEEHHGLDPHIWVAPAHVMHIAKNIYTALAKADTAHAEDYRKNYETFLKKVAETDAKIGQILHALKPQSAFMVFHPSWGYFAQAYDLRQVAIEVEGKSPKPRQLVQLIKEAKEKKVRAIFTAPEFSDAIARQISNALHIPVVKISPLAANWSENLLTLARAIAGK